VYVASTTASASPSAASASFSSPPVDSFERFPPERTSGAPVAAAWIASTAHGFGESLTTIARSASSAASVVAAAATASGCPRNAVSAGAIDQTAATPGIFFAASRSRVTAAFGIGHRRTRAKTMFGRRTSCV
jgi:hypothetical protein